MKHRLLMHDRGIEIENWTITVDKGPILNSSEMENWSQTLDAPLPEMTFGHSSVSIKHSSGKLLEFNAFDALKSITHNEPLKLHYAKDWQTNRKSHQDLVKVVKPYDWTFTSSYQGTTEFEFIETEDSIDLEKLKQPDPILYYNEIHLYEDELADNGMSTFLVKLRVMPTCFLVLARFFLRVDNQLFRVKDHRFYHEFGQDHVIYENFESESDFDSVKKKLPTSYLPEPDLKPLTDSQWVSSTIQNSQSGIFIKRKLLL